MSWTLGVELEFNGFLWQRSVAGKMRRIAAWAFGWLAIETYRFVGGGPYIARSRTLRPSRYRIA